jgi:multidrug efflux system membrane fusion protein
MNPYEITSQPDVTQAPRSPLAFLAPRKVWVPLTLLALLLCGLVMRSCFAGAKQAPKVRSVPVATAVVRVGDIDIHYTGLGTVVTLDTITLKSRVDGAITRINFTEGQMVKAGAELVEIDPRPYQVALMQAEGQLAKDEAALKNAQKDLVRYNRLVAQGIISTQQADTQVSLVDQDAAAVKVDQAAMASAKLNLVYCHITTPIAGRVGLRTVDAGNLVHASDTTGLVVVTPVQPINVMFTLSADQLPAVMAANHGGKALVVEAYDRDDVKRLAVGTLQSVDNQIDTTTGTIKLKGLFRNEDLTLFPNQFVNIHLKVTTLHDALIVPSACLQRSPDGIYLYAVKPDSTVELRTVDVQYTEGDSTVVRSGVKAGDIVVTDGIEKLKPGARVNTGAPESKAPAKAAH